MSALMAYRIYRVKDKYECDGEVMILSVAIFVTAVGGIMMVSSCLAGVINPEGAAIRAIIK